VSHKSSRFCTYWIDLQPSHWCRANDMRFLVDSRSRISGLTENLMKSHDVIIISTESIGIDTDKVWLLITSYSFAFYLKSTFNDPRQMPWL
jgi:hypothetical protein